MYYYTTILQATNNRSWIYPYTIYTSAPFLMKTIVQISSQLRRKKKRLIEHSIS
jgi:hypothetical protein